MTFPSHPTSVPQFHSLGNGTVEQTLNQWNSPRNMSGTFSLKALASKVLERNKDWNIYGTMVFKPVPHPDQPVPLRGTKNEEKVFPEKKETSTDNTDRFKMNPNMSVLSVPPGENFDKESLLYDYEEHLAIAEVDGNQTPIEAHRIAYLDAFISLLSDLAEKDPHQDWLAEKIQTALAILEAQHFPTLN